MVDVTQADMRRRKQVHKLTGYVDMDMKLAIILARHRIAAHEAGKLEGARLMQEAAAAKADEYDDKRSLMTGVAIAAHAIRALDPATVLRNAAGGDA